MTKPLKRKKRKKLSWREQVRHIIRARLLSGLLVIVPLGITVYVISFMYVFTAGRLTPVVRRMFGTLPEYVVPLVSLALLFLFFYFLGLITSVLVGRKLVNLLESVIQRIPLVKTVYGSSKQIVLSLSAQDAEGNFESVVFVDFPHPGMKSLAFVTGRVEIEGEGEHLKLFVPTTPNPTSGYFELVRPERALRVEVSVEDAVALVISGGIVNPPSLALESSEGADESASGRPTDDRLDG
jgi:uncharacterized membrane protein